VADFVTLHVPLLEATRNLINAQRIGLMRPDAVLLNFAREGVVDNAAVIEALDANKLRAYICDFPANVLKGHPKVVALPHLGASTGEAEENCAVMVAEQLADYLENGNILNSVNFPNVGMARESAFRLAIANANVPNMVGQISAVLAGAGLNIHNMVNKSKGDMAYTLVDIDSAATAAVIAAAFRHRRRPCRAVPARMMDDGALKELRERIDSIDDTLLQLVSERAAIAQEVGRTKKGEKIYRPEREAQIVRRLRETNPGPLSGDAVERLIREVMSACRALEQNHPHRLSRPRRHLQPAGGVQAFRP
jgi:chorismate mutase-like protein